MISVKSTDAIRYHVYHIVTLFYPAARITYLEERREEETDIHVVVEGEKLSVDFFGERYEAAYPGRNLNIMRRLLFTLLEKKTGKHLPWGILIGIRPSKIVRELIEAGKTEDEIVKHLGREYLADEEKIRLAYEVALKEYELLRLVQRDHACDIYVGMPFCPSRCLYCSFTSNIYRGSRFKNSYLERLKEEMNHIRKYLDENNLSSGTVYFGGGTPTAVSDEEFEDIMKALYASFIEGRDTAEFTVEAGRVDSITENKLLTMKKYGVTRISINPQTMNDDTLKLIGRNHNRDKVKEVYGLAREMGFNNINMDIILGLPGENIKEVMMTLEDVKAMAPESLTVHGLALKRASRLYEDLLLEKKYALPAQKEMNLMYEKADETARSLGLLPYYMYRQKNMVGNLENVGYAKKGCENFYNMIMIEEIRTIIGVGADAVTKKVEDGKIRRFANFKGLDDYTERFGEMMEKKIRFLNNKE